MPSGNRFAIPVDLPLRCGHFPIHEKNPRKWYDIISLLGTDLLPRYHPQFTDHLWYTWKMICISSHNAVSAHKPTHWYLFSLWTPECSPFCPLPVMCSQSVALCSCRKAWFQNFVSFIVCFIIQLNNHIPKHTTYILWLQVVTNSNFSHQKQSGHIIVLGVGSLSY